MEALHCFQSSNGQNKIESYIWYILFLACHSIKLVREQRNEKMDVEYAFEILNTKHPRN
jgi:hypothetical protein